MSLLISMFCMEMEKKDEKLLAGRRVKQEFWL